MIRPLPPAPSRDNPGPFASQSDALLAALDGFVEDSNRLEQSLIFVGTTGQSATPLAVGAGTKTLTASTGKAWVVGAWVHLVSAGGIGNVMVGQVQAYDVDTGALQVNIGAFAGSGTHSDWLIGLSSPQAPITAALIASGAIAARVAADGGLTLPGNAVNPLDAMPLQQATGRLLAVRVFTTANNGQTYTPTAGTTSVVVEAVGGGGAGGGGVTTTFGNASLGSGGSGGAFGMARFTSGFAGVTITIGSGGTAAIGGNGGAGGTTSFGALLSCPGGVGGGAGGIVENTVASYSAATALAAAPSGANIQSHRGYSCDRAYLLGGGSQSGGGGSTLLGSGGPALTVPNTGAAGDGYGAGGGGGTTSGSAASSGGNGAPGVIIVWEYA